VGTIRKPEAISKLAKLTATTLSLPASTLNIGGQQYNTLAALTLNTATVGAGGVDATVAAGAIYTVYAVISSGQVYLIASLNSSLPSGFTQARAVGGFNTNGASQIVQVASTSGDLSVAGSITALNAVRTEQDTKNYLINGGLDFWQRGTSFLTLGSYPVYTADRWYLYFTSINPDASRLTSGLPSTSTSRYGLHLVYTWVGGGYGYCRYIMEGNDARMLYGKNVTLSFWMRASRAGQISITLGSSNLDRTYTSAATITTANTWQLITKTVYIDNSSGTWNLDETAGLYIYINLNGGSSSQAATQNTWLSGNYRGLATDTVFQLNDTFDFCDFMLNVGSQAAPFTRAGGTMGGELSLCQRYYERISQEANVSDYYTEVGQGSVGNANSVYTTFFFKATKRIVVTSSARDTSGSFSVNAVNGFACGEYYGCHTNGTRLRFDRTSHGLTTGYCYDVSFNAAAQTNGYIAFNAEL